MSTEKQSIEQHVEAEILAAIPEAEKAATSAELQSHDYRAVHARHLEQLAQQVEALPPITDRATYDQNQRMRTHLVSVRTGIDKRRKALFEPLRRLKAEVDAYLGTGADSGLQGRIAAMEAAIRAKQDAYDQEQERKRQEAQRIVDERNKARGQALMRLGFRFDGVTYEIGTPKHELYGAMAAADVSAMNEDGWLTCLKRCEAHAEKVRAAFLEEQRTADLKAKGCIEDPESGNLVWPSIEEQRFVRTAGTLGTVSDEDWVKELAMLDGLVKLRERERTERERRLAEEAERQRDEVARLRQVVRQVRIREIVDLGAYVLPGVGGDKLDTVSYEEDATEMDAYDLASLSDEDWREAREYIYERVQQSRAAVQQERHERLMGIGVQQAPEGFYFVPMGDSLTDRRWECVANLADLSAEDWATARTTAMQAVTDAKAAAEAAANRPAPEPAKEEPEADMPDVAEHIPEQFMAEAEEGPAAAPEPGRSDADKVAAVVVSIEGARDEVRAMAFNVKGDNARKVMEELDAVLTSALRIAREFTTQYTAR